MWVADDPRLGGALLQMVDQAPVAHVLFDGDLVLRYVNDRACAILGLPCGRLVGRRLRDLVAERARDPERVERVIALCGRVMADGAPARFTGWEVLVDGGSRSVFCDWEIRRLEGADGSFLALSLSDVTAHVQALRALDQSEARHRMLVEQAREYAIIMLDPQGRVATWNTGAQRIFGYHETEILGQPGARFFTCEDVQAGVPEREAERAARTGQSVNERWHVRRDGERFFAVGMLTAIRDGAGSLIGFSKIIRDRTEQKKAEDALRASEQRFRLLVDQMHAYAIFFLDLERRVTVWTASAERMLGYRSDEMVGASGDLLFTDEDRAAGAPRIEAEVAARDGQSADNRWHQRKGGARLHVDGAMVALRDEDGGIRGFAKVMLDDTERIRLEEDLRATTERFELAQRAAGIGIFEWDLDGGTIVWSEEVARIHGVDLAAFSGEPSAWTRFILPEHLPTVEVQWREVAAHGASWRSEFRIRRGDGTVRWISAEAAVLSRSPARPRRLLGTISDITERKEATDALRQANRDLEQFASVTSHDLQEPLRMVIGYLELLRRRTADLAPNVREYIDKAIEGSGRMQRLIRHILDIARIGSSKPVVRSVDTTGAFAEAVANLGKRIEETGAEVRHGPLPVVRAEYEHLVRLFQNLVGNGIKYRRPGVAPSVRVDAVERDDGWEFAVSDNGIGIPEIARDEIFTLFVRLHDANDADGAGLGLAICKRIVDRHHGRIWVESEVGVGSTFRFTLPR
jgi:PAS domain S-box-containing protein